MKELPYKMESILCAEDGVLPGIGRNRRPSVQRIIEAFWREEKRTPGHEHFSMTGLTAHVIAVHLTINNREWTLRSNPRMGYFIKVDV